MLLCSKWVCVSEEVGEMKTSQLCLLLGFFHWTQLKPGWANHLFSRGREQLLKRLVWCKNESCIIKNKNIWKAEFSFTHTHTVGLITSGCPVAINSYHALKLTNFLKLSLKNNFLSGLRCCCMGRMVKALWPRVPADVYKKNKKIKDAEWRKGEVWCLHSLGRETACPAPRQDTSEDTTYPEPLMKSQSELQCTAANVFRCQQQFSSLHQLDCRHETHMIFSIMPGL